MAINKLKERQAFVLSQLQHSNLRTLSNKWHLGDNLWQPRTTWWVRSRKTERHREDTTTY